MNRNTIVVERPAHGSAYTLDGSTNQAVPLRIWLPGGPDYVCLRAKVMGVVGNWKGAQVHGITDGRPRKVVFWPAGTGYGAAWSFPDGAWASGARYNRRVFQHASYNPARRCVWTADRDYAYVAINCYYYASNSDITVSYSGSGTLLQNTLDCHTSSSPFKADADSGSQFFMMGKQKFLTIASDVKTGDTLTFNVPVSTLSEICCILGIPASVEYGTPDDTDCVHLGPDMFVDGDPAVDPQVTTLCVPRDVCGNTLAPKFTPAQPLTYWGTDEHADANNGLTGAGGSGSPTMTFYYYDDTYPLGRAWNLDTPVQGTRKTCRAFEMRITGEAKMGGTQAGAFRESLIFDALGFSHWWEIYFNIAIPSGLTWVAGYPSMFMLSSAAGFALTPNTVSPVKLAGAAPGWVLIGNGQQVWVYGGGFKNRVVEFTGNGSPFVNGCTIRIDKKPAGSNKIYITQPLTFSEAPVLYSRYGCGYRLNVYDRNEMRPVSPRGYRR